jgi:hypothetical protein
MQPIFWGLFTLSCERIEKRGNTGAAAAIAFWETESDDVSVLGSVQAALTQFLCYTSEVLL